MGIKEMGWKAIFQDDKNKKKKKKGKKKKGKKKNF